MIKFNAQIQCTNSMLKTNSMHKTMQIQCTKQLNLGMAPPGKFKTKKYWGKMVGLRKPKLQILHTKVLKQEKIPGKFFAQNFSKVLKQKTFWLLLVLVLQHTKVLKQVEIRPNLPKQILHTKVLKQEAFTALDSKFYTQKCWNRRPTIKLYMCTKVLKQKIRPQANSTQKYRCRRKPS